MHDYKRAIVVYEPSKQEQPAVLRAVKLAKKFNLELVLVAVVYDRTYEIYSLLDNTHPETLKKNLINSTKLILNDLCEGIEQQGVSCNNEVIWGSRVDEEISTIASRDDMEIVIKSTYPHSSFKSIFFTPTDWKLLRHCPTPVLLVKQKDWLERGAIIVAVDSTSDDPEHQQLNRNLLRHARNISDINGNKIHLVNVYPIPVLEVPVEFSAVNYQELQQQSKALHENQTRQLAEDYAIPESQQHVVAGLPEEVLAEKVDELDGHLLLIGTVARSGLTAAIIGNTAEHTVDKVSCDVLALKTTDYIDFLTKIHLKNE